MNISDILDSVKNGKLSVKEAKKQLSLYSIEEIENFAKIDLGREARKGIPEVISVSYTHLTLPTILLV